MDPSPKKTARELLEAQGKLDPSVVAVKLASRRGSDAVVDLMTPLPETELAAGFHVVRKDSPEGLEVIRHSTAHVMADAVQKLFPGTKVTFGPATDNGFYYDFDRPGGTFSEEDLERIEAKMREIVASKSPFRREAIARQDAIDLFTRMGETYKVEWMRSLPEDTEFTVYKHGAPGQEWVDFCKGPHVPSTELLAAVKLTAVSGTYWRGDERNPQLQRIYGTAFHSEKALAAYLKQLEEAKARDHRKLGKELELFAFDGTAVASPFFLPRGAKIYNRMIDYIRDVYVRYRYEEIITPQVYSTELFKTSGHLANYAESMYYAIAADDLADGAKFEKVRQAILAPDKSEEQLELLAREVRGVKPMNCPGHCQLFSHRKRSYRELPWRCADFGRLHRYERGGVVHGLARVRTFCQDDAHIFCAPEQMEQEIVSFNALLDEVYGAFGFTDVRIKLATRPERRVGADSLWDAAEKALEDALRNTGRSFDLAEGEGAFYGPKLEFHVKDAIGRSWQLGTIQVDFNMPARFGLKYVDHEGKDQTPVMLHRAILGSLERFFAVYLEHVGGNFPVWLAPEQVCLLTVSEKVEDYAREALAYLESRGVRAVADFSPDKLGAKIRNARGMRYPYLAVVGAKEAETRALALRRGNDDLGAMSLEDVAARIAAEGAFPRAPEKK
ncbi:MAG: threonine--tRNA ligase [Deltaproteobacteria bacterium]|nr:threonine--tRNA ligase [Deltaproteobacteria bacterium]